jgi:hypothetical protein
MRFGGDNRTFSYHQHPCYRWETEAWSEITLFLRLPAVTGTRLFWLVVLDTLLCPSPKQQQQQQPKNCDYESPTSILKIA